MNSTFFMRKIVKYTQYSPRLWLPASLSTRTPVSFYLRLLPSYLLHPCSRHFRIKNALFLISLSNTSIFRDALRLKVSACGTQNNCRQSKQCINPNQNADLRQFFSAFWPVFTGNGLLEASIWGKKHMQKNQHHKNA